jgi:hypothetical protein
MSPKTLFCAGVVAASAWIAGCERPVSFADDIQPILTDSCVRCHDGNAEGEAVSGLNLTSYEGVMQGTRYGKVVVPGSAMSSALYLTVAGKTGPEIRMPPHHEGKWAQGEGVPLSENYIETIERWIDQGAKDN